MNNEWWLEGYEKPSDWLRFRRHWLDNNPPLDNHCYLCGICGRWVFADEVTLDHILGRDGALMFDPLNIQPAHGYCNYMKGSRKLKPKATREVYEFLNWLSD